MQKIILEEVTMTGGKYRGTRKYRLASYKVEASRPKVCIEGFSPVDNKWLHLINVTPLSKEKQLKKFHEFCEILK